MEIETQDNHEVNESLGKQQCTNPNIVRSQELNN